MCESSCKVIVPGVGYTIATMFLFYPKEGFYGPENGVVEDFS